MFRVAFMVGRLLCRVSSVPVSSHAILAVDAHAGFFFVFSSLEDVCSFLFVWFFFGGLLYYHTALEHSLADGANALKVAQCKRTALGLQRPIHLLPLESPREELDRRLPD